GVRLDPRAEVPHLVLVERVGEDHAVRVPDRYARHGEEPVGYLERHADDLAIRAVHRDLRRAERGVSHLAGPLVHALAGGVAHRLDDAALRLDPHRRFPEATALPEVLREDPEPVAGLLGLASVWVEDAEPDVGDARVGPEQDAVRSDAPVAMADPADCRRPEQELELALLHHEVVVAEPVALGESRHGQLTRDIGAARGASRDEPGVGQRTARTPRPRSALIEGDPGRLARAQ